MADREEEDSYSGESSYRYVDALIGNDDSELMVVSPYISDYYTKMLLNKARNKRTRIITSESSMSYRDAMLNRYVAQSTRGHIKAIAFFILLDLISVYLQFNYTTAIITIILLALILLAYRKYRKTGTNLKVKVANGRFVHEKLYIGKDIAIVGSANLTYNGMHRNVEHIDVIRDENRIKQLKQHFESLWSSS